MRKIAVPVLTLGLLALATPPPANAILVTQPPLVVSHAEPVGGTTFQGGCGFFVFNDTTPGGLQGGANAHNGIVYMSITTLTGVSVSARCELRVNGVPGGAVNPVLGPTAGRGAGGVVVVEDAKTLRYVVSPTDVVSICTIVTYGTTPPASQTSCVDASDTVVVPSPVAELVVTTLNAVLTLVDPTICEVFKIVRQFTNPLTSPTLNFAADGDIFVNGTKLYDCPPYTI